MLDGAQSMKAGRLPWSYSNRQPSERYQEISYDDLFALLVSPPTLSPSHSTSSRMTTAILWLVKAVRVWTSKMISG
jgi:hypothetical protein